MMSRDVSKISADSFFQSIGTLRETDLRNEIGQIQVPLLGIYGKRDRIVNPRQSKVLKEYAPDAEIAWFPKAGHFPMLDQPEKFHQTIYDFLMQS